MYLDCEAGVNLLLHHCCWLLYGDEWDIAEAVVARGMIDTLAPPSCAHRCLDLRGEGASGLGQHLKATSVLVQEQWLWEALQSIMGRAYIRYGTALDFTINALRY